jgi:hypothetical protein
VTNNQKSTNRPEWSVLASIIRIAARFWQENYRQKHRQKIVPMPLVRSDSNAASQRIKNLAKRMTRLTMGCG